MSGVINKIKDALHADKSHSSDANEHGTQSGVHDQSTSVAHGSSISPTNPGVLNSTQYGIHGQRDPGTGTSIPASGNDQGLTGSASGPRSSKAAVEDGSIISATTRAAPDSTTTSTTGGSAGPQFTGDNTRDTDLVGSGLTSSGAKTGETGAGMAGTGYDDRNRDPTLGGAGGVRGTGTGTGLVGDTNTRDLTDTTATGSSGLGSAARDPNLTGNTNSGSGLGTDKRDAGIVGETAGAGLVADDGLNRGGLSNTTGGSGLGGTRGEGLGDQSTTTMSTTAGSGFAGIGTGSDLGGSSNTTTGRSLESNTTGTGVGTSGEAGRYMEGSERHHRGDGHPEDIVHPGPHVTGTAKALDPHFD